MTTPRVALVSVLGLLAGCADRPISAVDPEPHSVERKDVPVTQNAKLDLLFVVDNSGSMFEEQTSLKENFPQFMQQLAGLEGGLPDIHIGVISTNVGVGTSWSGCTADGDDGALLTNGCAGIDGVFLEDVTGPNGRVRNYQGALEDQFKCMAALGTRGCGAEQPLESLRRALEPSNARNAGFLRPDSVLAIILITDEDDCSTRDRALFTRPGSTDSVIFGCTEFGITCDQADLRTPGAKTNCRPRASSPYLFDVDEYVQFVRRLRPSTRELRARRDHRRDHLPQIDAPRPATTTTRPRRCCCRPAPARPASSAPPPRRSASTPSARSSPTRRSCRSATATCRPPSTRSAP